MRINDKFSIDVGSGNFERPENRVVNITGNAITLSSIRSSATAHDITFGHHQGDPMLMVGESALKHLMDVKGGHNRVIKVDVITTSTVGISAPRNTSSALVFICGGGGNQGSPYSVTTTSAGGSGENARSTTKTTHYPGRSGATGRSVYTLLNQYLDYENTTFNVAVGDSAGTLDVVTGGTTTRIVTAPRGADQATTTPDAIIVEKGYHTTLNTNTVLQNFSNINNVFDIARKSIKRIDESRLNGAGYWFSGFVSLTHTNTVELGTNRVVWSEGKGMAPGSVAAIGTNTTVGLRAGTDGACVIIWLAKV